MIRFNCSCGREFKVADEQAGKKGKCPACGSVNLIPAQPPADPPPPPPPPKDPGRIRPDLLFALGIVVLMVGFAVYRWMDARRRPSVTLSIPTAEITPPTPKQDEASFEQNFKAAVRRSDPATWIAMMDLGRILADDSPESVQVGDVFKIAQILYKEDRKTMAELIIDLVTEEREAGRMTLGSQILIGSVSAMPMESMIKHKPLSFASYIESYQAMRIKTVDHRETMENMREFNSAYWGRIDSPSPTKVSNDDQSPGSP